MHKHRLVSLSLILAISPPLFAYTPASFFDDAWACLRTPNNVGAITWQAGTVGMATWSLQHMRAQNYVMRPKELVLMSAATFMHLFGPARIEGGIEEVYKAVQQKPHESLDIRQAVRGCAGSLVLASIGMLHELCVGLAMLGVANQQLLARGDAGFWKRHLAHFFYTYRFRQAQREDVPNECIVCYEQGTKWVAPCSKQAHVIGGTCATTWADQNSTCPTCRGDFVGERAWRSPQQVVRLVRKNGELRHYIVPLFIVYGALAPLTSAYQKAKGIWEGVALYRELKAKERELLASMRV